VRLSKGNGGLQVAGFKQEKFLQDEAGVTQQILDDIKAAQEAALTHKETAKAATQERRELVERLRATVANHNERLEKIEGRLDNLAQAVSQVDETVREVGRLLKAGLSPIKTDTEAAVLPESPAKPAPAPKPSEAEPTKTEPAKEEAKPETRKPIKTLKSFLVGGPETSKLISVLEGVLLGAVILLAIAIIVSVF
jgi:DNA repair exonuclease SbcCD ATPase subunit